MVAKILSGLVGLIMLSTTVNWIFDPAGAAASLGINTILDGIGRSTLIGDFTAFFAAITTFIAIGIYKEEGKWLFSAAIILGLAAVFRNGAWLIHGADYAMTPIIAEILFTIILVYSGRQLNKTG